jgi:hypothetical protein
MLQLPPFRYLSNNAALYAGTALAPVAITSATSFNTAENTTAVATLTATGGGTITWSKTGGADTAKFSIGSSSGVLAFVSPPDFETPTDADVNNIYVVQVQATNGTMSDTKTINVTVTDVGEWATLNGTPAQVTLSNGNLTVTAAGVGLGGARSLSNKASGKLYFECKVDSSAASSTADSFGVATAAASYTNIVTGGTNGTFFYMQSGQIWSNNVNSGKTIGGTNNNVAGNIFAVAVDQVNHRGWFRKVAPTLGNWNNDASADPATNVGGVTIASAGMEPIFGHNGDAAARQHTFNFGASAFAGTVPSGFTSGWPL